MSFERQQTELFFSDEIRRQIPLFIRLSPEELNKSSASVKTHSILKDRITGGLADKKPASFFSSRAVKRGAKVEREHTVNPSIAREIARDHLAEDKKYYEKLSKIEKDRKKETKKAIPGQQEFMARVGKKDPMYATHTPNIHVEAAKHYIQADYHNRQPGGRPLSEHHSQQFGELQKQGAAPKAEHFKTAMHQLHPKFSQAMKSNNPSLYVKALTGEYRSRSTYDLSNIPDAPKHGHTGPGERHAWEKYHGTMAASHAEAARISPDPKHAAAHAAARDAHKQAISTIREGSRKLVEHGSSLPAKTMQAHSRRAMTQSEHAFRTPVK